MANRLVAKLMYLRIISLIHKFSLLTPSLFTYLKENGLSINNVRIRDGLADLLINLNLELLLHHKLTKLTILLALPKRNLHKLFCEKLSKPNFPSSSSQSAVSKQPNCITGISFFIIDSTGL